MKYRKKPVVIEAITFDELVEHGRRTCGANVHNSFPCSFDYAGHPITHENDDCYLIPTAEGTMKMGRGDMLITGVKGEIYPCKRDIFEATYVPADETAPDTSIPVKHVGTWVDLALQRGAEKERKQILRDLRGYAHDLEYNEEPGRFARECRAIMDAAYYIETKTNLSSEEASKQ